MTGTDRRQEAHTVDTSAGRPGVPAWRSNETPISVRPRPAYCFRFPFHQEFPNDRR